MSLFSQKTFEEYYLELLNRIQLEIVNEQDEYIIMQPTEDLIKYYSSRCLKPIKIDPEKEPYVEPRKFVKTIRSHERERGYQDQGDTRAETETIRVEIPILPNKDIDIIASLRPNKISISSRPSFQMSSDHFLIEFETRGYGLIKTNEEINSTIVSTREYITNYIFTTNAEISRESDKLLKELTKFITARKEKLDADKKRINELVKLINLPLRRKDEALVKKIHIDERPFVKRIKPQAGEVEYQLDRERVIDIITLLNNQCLQFEKTPQTYARFGETNLRDLLLANLNSVFEGKATAETFNSQGKTDIYLNLDKGSILVSECQFYGGEALYHKTIDQLLGYLTWRQNYGIMISFCNQKNFTRVLDDAESIIKKHSSYAESFLKKGKAHLISRHTLPSDDYKYMELHHLYCNLYVK